MLDIPNERGMSEADIEYGNAKQCNFPLFDFLKPLSAEWMLVIYGIMFLGAFGIMLGFLYRLSCLFSLYPIGICSFWTKLHGIIILTYMVLLEFYFY